MVRMVRIKFYLELGLQYGDTVELHADPCGPPDFHADRPRRHADHSFRPSLGFDWLRPAKADACEHALAAFVAGSWSDRFDLPGECRAELGRELIDWQPIRPAAASR
jgi:hypothetical protein